MKEYLLEAPEKMILFKLFCNFFKTTRNLNRAFIAVALSCTPDRCKVSNHSLWCRSFGSLFKAEANRILLTCKFHRQGACFHIGRSGWEGPSLRGTPDINSTTHIPYLEKRPGHTVQIKQSNDRQKRIWLKCPKNGQTDQSY